MIGKKGKIKDEFRVTLQVKEETIDIDINDKLHIPSIDVLTPQKACNMMAENPALHARWNVLSNQAAVEFDKEKMSFEIWCKEKSKQYRVDLKDMGMGRITDKMVEEAVMTDPEYKRRFIEMLRRKEDAANVRSIAFGFGERGERLVNIVSMMKSEKPTSSLKDNSSYVDDNDDVKAFSDKDTEDEV